MTPLVLAIEPDPRQAAIVKRIVREKALADVTVVDSRDAAIEVMRTAMPDVLLLTALLSPRDEDELMAHLRTLDHAAHLQTHTIPQLASTLETPVGRVSRGLLSAFRRKKEPEPVASGCDPDLFAEEIRVFIQRAADKKRALAESGQASPSVRVESRVQDRAAAPVQDADEAASAASSWSSPFEWRSSGPLRSASTEADFIQQIKTGPVAPVSLADTATHTEPPQIGPEFAEIAAPDPIGAVVEPVFQPPMAEEPIPVIVAASAQEPEPIASTAAAPFAEVEPVAIVVEQVSIEVEPAAMAVAPPSAPREMEIVLPAAAEKRAEAASEWAAPPPPSPPTKGSDRLGPLAGWARIEQPRQPKPAAVTADDVRALISSLAVPPAVASVTYARGCRIRRVRVPAAPEHEASEAFGTVILSRRVLDEQRERRPSA